MKSLVWSGLVRKWDRGYQVWAKIRAGQILCTAGEAGTQCASRACSLRNLKVADLGLEIVGASILGLPDGSRASSGDGAGALSPRPLFQRGGVREREKLLGQEEAVPTVGVKARAWSGRSRAGQAVTCR